MESAGPTAGRVLSLQGGSKGQTLADYLGTVKLQKNSVYRISRYILDGAQKFVSSNSVKNPRFVACSNTNSRGDLENFSQKRAGIMGFWQTLVEIIKDLLIDQLS